MSKIENEVQPSHEPGMHADRINAALKGIPEPRLAPDDEKMERWDDLVPSSDPEKVSIFLHKKRKVTLFHKAPELVKIAEGNEHDVYRERGILNRSKVIKLDKVPIDEETALERFHVHETMRELTPKNIPIMYDSFSTEGGSGIIVERIKKHPLYDVAIKFAGDDKPSLLNKITKFPFESVLETWDEIGITRSFDGTKPSNYWVDKDGRKIFMDSFLLTRSDLAKKRDKIITYMRDHSDRYDDPTITRVSGHLDALDSLGRPSQPIQNAA